MTIDQIRYFLTLAETQNFTLAAKRANITQPSLTQQIQQLEKSLHTKLFDRLPRKTILTNEGRNLLDRARALLNAFDNLQYAPQSTELTGPLAIAASATLAPFVVAQTAGQFAKAHPKVQLALHELSAPIILEQTAAGLLDLAIVTGPVANPALLIEPLFSENLILAIPKAHPFALRPEIPLAKALSQRLILLDELADSFPSATLKNPIQAHGLQIASALELVAAGAALCPLPAMARSTQHPHILYKPFQSLRTSHPPIRLVSALHHRDRQRPRAALTFLHLLRQTIAQTL